ncbi:MAG: hypothetical protein M3461_20395 [Pseudomonadota bacterium]|nr:hypothetical protein [Pseudomonadota bacterium]
MVIDRNETRVCALEQLRAFLKGTGGVRLQSVGDEEGRCSHLQAVLKRFTSLDLPSGQARTDKGLVLRYLGRTTGYSRQH